MATFMVNSQAKGKRAEGSVVAALVRAGLPARRHVRTGTADVHDEGDIRLETAPVTIEVKDWAKAPTAAQLLALIVKLGRQKRPGDLGLLVVKRSGHADAASWYCWVSGLDATRLLGTPDGTPQSVYVLAPVCFTLGDVLRLVTLDDWTHELVNPFR